MTKKIFLVGMPNSVHISRWVKQLAGSGWEVSIYPSIADVEPHEGLNGVEIIRPFLFFRNIAVYCKLNLLLRAITWLGQKHESLFPAARINKLVYEIKRRSPDLVHSIEIQGGGYIALEAKKIIGAGFPKWLVTNWGSDIYLFGKLKKHEHKIKSVLSACDFYSCECLRDIELAHQFGFKGQSFPVYPNTGGFDLQMVKDLKKAETSARRLIMLKGYQNWAGRALFGLRALERVSDLLQGYEVCIYSASEDVLIAAELFTGRTGIPAKIIPNGASHQLILELHSKARISMGLSISDAISTSFLEAIVMGAFPIQSCTACANEWIEHGAGGMIVPPEDTDLIEMALRVALTDDQMVDNAARLNWEIAKKRLCQNYIRSKVLDMYSVALGESK
jgi:hypothetical protein